MAICYLLTYNGKSNFLQESEIAEQQIAF